ncbi:hypothetical protein PMKS-002777 [Pichia membranifaciens]|uniref:NmrA-like domain-containing protein n=1 Tax=Pichia membranifaciens TaxID=4926 RepID=A0A1Q2YIE9_9ASCO|nr:hypothetical protein PMKS-002777 [Pichia membranifaciens]
MGEKKLFITGATGYIGGEILHQVLQSFPAFEVTALVRSVEKGELIEEQTKRKVKTVLGSLDSLELIRKETESSDIIINAASNNHLASLKVIKDALSKKTSETLFIQISGAGVISDSLDPEKYTPNKVYDDVKDIEEINSLDDSQPHRPADKLTLSIEETNPKFVKTAIISPPTIFGISDGYDRKHSVQVPLLAIETVKVGYSFTVHKGDTRWSHVHIYDVGTLYVSIIKKFIEKEEFRSGYFGYYFTNDGIDFTWKEVTTKVVEALYSRKLIKNKEIRELSPKEVDELFHLPALYWGTNARTKAEAGKLLGWSPVKSGDSDFLAAIDLSIDYLEKQGLLTPGTE